MARRRDVRCLLVGYTRIPQNRDLVSTYGRDIKLTQSALVNHCINRVIRKPAVVYANSRSNAR